MEKQIHPLLDQRIEEYCEKLHSNKDKRLQEVVRQTHLRFIKPHMVSGDWQGALLMMICNLLSPNRVLEVGTFSGYATLCFAFATKETCKIDTIEALQEYEEFLLNSFRKNKVEHKINLHFGQGLEVIKKLDHTYDLIFIDAEKLHYPDYYDICIDKLNKGGVLLADNILWYGKVVLEDIKDKETQAIRNFNCRVTQDDRVDNLILPIRDGIMMARKK